MRGPFGAPVADPRLRPGAYIAHGVQLFRVQECQATRIALEDVYRSNSSGAMLKDVPVRDVVTDYTLVRAA